MPGAASTSTSSPMTGLLGRGLETRKVRLTNTELMDRGYVIFMLGSMGKPRGTTVCSHAAWCTDMLACGPSEQPGPNTQVGFTRP